MNNLNFEIFRITLQKLKKKQDIQRIFFIMNNKDEIFIQFSNIAKWQMQEP